MTLVPLCVSTIVASENLPLYEILNTLLIGSIDSPLRGIFMHIWSLRSLMPLSRVRMDWGWELNPPSPQPSKPTILVEL